MTKPDISAEADRIISDWEYQACERDNRDPIRAQILQEAATLRALAAEVERLREEALDWRAQVGELSDRLKAAERERDEARALAEEELTTAWMAGSADGAGKALEQVKLQLLQEHETYMRSKGRNPLDYTSKFLQAANCLDALAQRGKG